MCEVARVCASLQSVKCRRHARSRRTSDVAAKHDLTLLRSAPKIVTVSLRGGVCRAHAIRKRQGLNVTSASVRNFAVNSLPGHFVCHRHSFTTFARQQHSNKNENRAEFRNEK